MEQKHIEQIRAATLIRGFAPLEMSSMKAKLMIFFAGLVCALILGISSAYAQSTNVIDKADVPFDFYVRNERMPAGIYYIAIDLESDMITISNNTGRRLFLKGNSCRRR